MVLNAWLKTALITHAPAKDTANMHTTITAALYFVLLYNCGTSIPAKQNMSGMISTTVSVNAFTSLLR
jgi:hypothetical protein